MPITSDAAARNVYRAGVCRCRPQARHRRQGATTAPVRFLLSSLKERCKRAACVVWLLVKACVQREPHVDQLSGVLGPWSPGLARLLRAGRGPLAIFSQKADCFGRICSTRTSGERPPAHISRVPACVRTHSSPDQRNAQISRQALMAERQVASTAWALQCLSSWLHQQTSWLRVAISTLPHQTMPMIRNSIKDLMPVGTALIADEQNLIAGRRRRSLRE